MSDPRAFFRSQTKSRSPKLLALLGFVLAFALPCHAQTVNIPDANLLAAIRTALEKPTGDITEADMLLLTQFDAPSAGIVDLTGLDKATNLTSLKLVGNQISNLAPLSGLTKLTVLWLGSNQVSDLSSLSGLTDLGNLILANNQISDLGPLGGLTKLFILRLDMNEIADLSGLSPLTGNSWSLLDFRDNQISDLGPLNGFQSPGNFNLQNNQIVDLSPISGFTTTRNLSLSNNQIDDLSPIFGYTSLESLSVDGNRINISPESPDRAFIDGLILDGVDVEYIPNADPNPVIIPDANLEIAIREAIGKPTGTIIGEDVIPLTELDIQNKGIADITGLERFSTLTSLRLENNPVSDLSPLSSLPNLTNLFITNANVSDLSPLANISSLRVLHASGNQISDINPLAQLPNLGNLILSENNITDLSPLSGLSNLFLLRLGSNPIEDFSPITGITRLEILSLDAVQIVDIPNLQNLPNLTSLGLSNNWIQDISPLIDLTSLTTVGIWENRIDISEGSEDRQIIDELTNRGVSVLYNPQRDPNSVFIRDPELESAIRTARFISSFEDVLEQDLQLLFKLTAENAGISNLTGLELAVNLTELDLSGNDIDDLTPIKDLENLDTLDVSGNKLLLGPGKPQQTILDSFLAAGVEVTLIDQNPDLGGGQIFNISTRSPVGNGEEVMIAGFIVEGPGELNLVMRALGPTISIEDGVTNALPNPSLFLFSGSNLIAENNDWVSSTHPASVEIFDSVGARQLRSDLDAALAISLTQGSYGIIVQDEDEAEGVGLVELFDESFAFNGSSATRLLNISTRAFTGRGEDLMIAGFSIKGDTPVTVLIQAVGNGIANEVSASLADPKLDLFDLAAGSFIASNDDWETGNDVQQILNTANSIGARVLQTGSKDAATLTTLEPNRNYAVFVAGANGGTGIVVVEVFAIYDN